MSEKTYAFMKKFRENRYIDLKKHLDENDIELLNKLGVKIEDKLYTEYELDLIPMKLVKFFNHDEFGNVMIEETESGNEMLTKCGVSPKDFLYISNKMLDLDMSYDEASSVYGDY